MSSWLLDEHGERARIMAEVKQCIALEYTPLSEWNDTSALAVLIKHKDHFEWMDISDAIPATSDREYSVPDTPKLTSVKPRAL